MRGGRGGRRRARKQKAYAGKNEALGGLLLARVDVRQSGGRQVSPFGCTGLLPCLSPAIMADGMAQAEHGMDVRGGPMHAWTFEPCLQNERVGAFTHP